MLVRRILSGVLGIGFFYIMVSWGSLPFFLFTALLTLLGLNEYYEMLGEQYFSSKSLFLFLGLFFLAFCYFEIINKYAGIAVFILFITIFISHIYKNSFKNIVFTAGINLLGIIYISGGFLFMSFLRDFSTDPFQATQALWLVLLGTWAVDTGAYFSGLFWGEKKLSPNISPNKTIEGAIGGLIMCLLVVILYSIIFNLFSIYIIILDLFLGPAAVLGDLFESALKRDLQVKDSGDIIPGHGGILDRFDSLLFSMPLSYYFLFIIL